MSAWIVWVILSFFTGNPILAAVVVFFLFWITGSSVFGIFSGPLQLLRRWRLAGRLAATLENNPHDRRTRLDLAEIWLGRRRYNNVIDLLRPSFDAGDRDATTMYVLGVACYGAGHFDTAEQLMAEAVAADGAFRGGQIDLERGRWRLKAGKTAEARDALERFVDIRKGTVEGRVLLSMAYRAAGDVAKSETMRAEAWAEYRTSPGFRRKIERLWAWRANPSRPVIYGAILLAVIVLVVAGFVGG